MSVMFLGVGNFMIALKYLLQGQTVSVMISVAR